MRFSQQGMTNWPVLVMPFTALLGAHVYAAEVCKRVSPCAPWISTWMSAEFSHTHSSVPALTFTRRIVNISLHLDRDRMKAERLWSGWHWAMAAAVVLYMHALPHCHTQRTHPAHTQKLTLRIHLPVSQPNRLFWHFCSFPLSLPHALKRRSPILVSRRGTRPNPWLTISGGGDSLI